jgi:hypothetical protein
LTPWSNAYIRDLSVGTIDVSSNNLNPVNIIGSSLGSVLKPWGNAYISDLSVGSIDVSVNLNPLNRNTSNIGSVLKPWNNSYIRDLSIGSIDISSNNLNPLISNNSRLGSALKPWGNAYIRDVSVGSINVSANLNPLLSLNPEFYMLGSGGVRTTDYKYVYHVFITTTPIKIFESPVNRLLDVMLVGGGGAGGWRLGSGGGGGGVVYLSNMMVNANQSYSLVVGAGGTSLANSLSTNGEDTTGFLATAAGGGRGISHTTSVGHGGEGGSGGGAVVAEGQPNTLYFGGDTSGNIIGPNTSGVIYGFRGGNITTGRGGGDPIKQAGGGGAGGQAANTNASITINTGQNGGGSGGPGVRLDIYNEVYYWGGGGGGACYGGSVEAVGGYGGIGGGGGGASFNTGTGIGGGSAITSGANGGVGLSSSGGAGGANSGGGGGGGTWETGLGGAGGSGIIIVRYLLNRSNIGSVLKPWNNAYIDDLSVASIDVSSNITPLTDNMGRLGSALKLWNNAYIRDLSIVSINDYLWTSGFGSQTINFMRFANNIIPATSNTYILGNINNTWADAFIRDLSVSSIDVSGNLAPLISSNSNLGTTLKTWNTANINNLDVTTINTTGDILPYTTNTGSLGSANNIWSVCQIDKLVLQHQSTTISNEVLYPDDIALLVVNPNPTGGTFNHSIIQVRQIQPTGGGGVTGWAFDISNSYGWQMSMRQGFNVNRTLFFYNTRDGTGTSYLNIDGASTSRLTYQGQIWSSTARITSDDRLKHNEIIINNGLAIIDQLTPKSYQKTTEMLDTNYYGDLSRYAWSYESGVIAQEVLQINDISYLVFDGDYYDESNNFIQRKYGLNYNSLFTYGLAATKELHTKVKYHESSILNMQSRIVNIQSHILNQQMTLNSLIARIEALEK